MRCALPDADLRALARAQRESVIAALSAAGLLAVLPDDHPAAANLQDIHGRGAVHLTDH